MKKRQYVVVILDQSGSMGPVCDVTINGFNEFIQSMKDIRNCEVLASMYLFNQDVRRMFFNRPMGTVEEITRDLYEPNGLTAMLDAVQEAILDMKEYLGEDADKEDVLFMIMSDGQENASKKASWTSVAERIQERQKFKWTFNYMGANQDLSKVSEKMNIPLGNMASYQNDAVGTYMATKAVKSYAPLYTMGCANPRGFSKSISTEITCEDCGQVITERAVGNFSVTTYGKILCRACQAKQPK